MSCLLPLCSNAKVLGFGRKLTPISAISTRNIHIKKYRIYSFSHIYIYYIRGQFNKYLELVKDGDRSISVRLFLVSVNRNLSKLQPYRSIGFVFTTCVEKGEFRAVIKHIYLKDLTANEIILFWLLTPL